MADMDDDFAAFDDGGGLPAAYPEYGVSPQLEPVQHPDYVGGAGEAQAPLGPPEHHSMMTHGVQNDVYAAAMPQRPRPPAPGEMPFNAQAVGQAPSGAGTLGASLLAVTIGGVAGGKYGGWAGAGAGVLFAGAAINAYRAMKSYKDGSDAGDKEGRVSALYTLVGAGGGAFLWTKYADKKRMARNPDDDVEMPETDFGEPCGIRPVGP
jgi:hypothetical protein